ncbi:MAG: fused response regulator/phosphatase [Rhodospirillaceae bacterium]
MMPDRALSADVMVSEERSPVIDSDILVVDDIEWNRALIGTLLEEAGYRNIRYAADGLEALDRIAESPPDLVILDIMMPNLDGFEVCKRMRADPAFADTPVLVQTALSGVEDRNRAFEAGTTDLVTKPLDRAELLARVNIHLENRALIRSLLLYRDRLEGELAMARAIFDHLLPAPVALARLEVSSGLAIRSRVLRSSELGGDIWGTLDLGNGRFGVYLLDLAGRGVSAALNVCRLHTLVQELSIFGEDPGLFLTELNRRAHGLLVIGEHAAMIYGVVSPAENRFSYACAAASNPLLISPDVRPHSGNTVGLPLGVTADTSFQQGELFFPQGTSILLHSNAILDALDRDPANGPSALAMLIESVPMTNNPTTDFSALVDRLERIVGNPPKDDHTLVWLRR